MTLKKMTTNSKIPYPIIKELLFSGIRFQYESYDHKKAVEEINNSPHYHSAGNFNTWASYCGGGVPPEIQQNHIVWRIGKLWQVYFNRNGEVWRVKIGQHYLKNFYIDDFGTRVKPMIFKSDDKYDLIGQGLAIEEKM